jgi:leucyl/phenylalanyl-tRNA--protein transferase
MIPADLLLDAYSQAVFPMAMEDGEIGWFSPDPRAVIPLDKFQIPHGLKRTLKKDAFEIRIDTAFEKVIGQCAARDETWISGIISESYRELHRLGHAHSVEAWIGEDLAGGLYGVTIGSAFFGESMFHRVTDASKVALCALVERLQQKHYRMLEVQWLTPHLKTFGAIEIPRVQYMKLLKQCVREEERWGKDERPEIQLKEPE